MAAGAWRWRDPSQVRLAAKPGNSCLKIHLGRDEAEVRYEFAKQKYGNGSMDQVWG